MTDEQVACICDDHSGRPCPIHGGGLDEWIARNQDSHLATVRPPAADVEHAPAQESGHSGARATNDAKRRFLQAFSGTGFIRSACVKTDIGRSTVYDWMKSDAAFAAVVKDIREDFADAVEEEIYQRAVVGWDEPQFGRIERDKDGLVGTVRKKSDRLLELLAKANRPEKFRERFELTGANGGPIETHELSDTERADRITALLETARARRIGSAPEGESKVGAVPGPTDTSGDNRSV